MERKYFEINERMAKSAHQMMSMRDYPEGSKTAEITEVVEEEQPEESEQQPVEEQELAA